MTEKHDVVYRLASPEEWKTTQETGIAPRRDIDERDGYMHLSTREQLLETARLHFAGAWDLLALEIPLDAIKADLKFELAPKRGEEFPHLYDALRLEHIAHAIRLEPADDGFRFGARL